jgi:hypothetical protein
MMVRAALTLFAALLAGVATAYEVDVKDEDYSRQSCSGMWANDYTYINGMCTSPVGCMTSEYLLSCCSHFCTFITRTSGL